MAIKSKKIKKKVKKNINLYSSSLEVKSKETELKNLQKSKKGIELEISELIYDFNDKILAASDPSNFIEKLPLNSLKEFENFSAGREISSNLGILRSKIQLRKDKDKMVDSLSLIDKQIANNKIELLLAKINHILIVK